MRLIDADELMENLREIKTLYGVPMTMRDEQMIHWIIGHIKEQPTAYDISKVVAELDKASFLMPPREKGHYADNGLFLEDAIEIVRKGGVE